jgi:hypothetical protein
MTDSDLVLPSRDMREEVGRRMTSLESFSFSEKEDALRNTDAEVSWEIETDVGSGLNTDRAKSFREEWIDIAVDSVFAATDSCERLMTGWSSAQRNGVEAADATAVVTGVGVTAGVVPRNVDPTITPSTIDTIVNLESKKQKC